jgi:hypothetical protein
MKQDYHRSGKTMDRIARSAPCDEGASLQLFLKQLPSSQLCLEIR